MNAIPFDTLKMARKLEAAGFPGAQAAGAAEAMAEAMSGAELATNADLLAVKTDVQAVKTDVQAVKTDVQAVKTDVQAVKTDVQAIRADLLVLRADLHGVKADLERQIVHETGLLRTDLTREIIAAETRQSIATMKVGSDLEILRRDMTIRLGAIVIASTGVLLTAMRLMVPHQ
jgi:septal ring factor EnvC (AmiA/AmiB activator)